MSPFASRGIELTASPEEATGESRKHSSFRRLAQLRCQSYRVKPTMAEADHPSRPPNQTVPCASSITGSEALLVPNSSVRGQVRNRPSRQHGSRPRARSQTRPLSSKTPCGQPPLRWMSSLNRDSHELARYRYSPQRSLWINRDPSQASIRLIDVGDRLPGKSPSPTPAIENTSSQAPYRRR